MWSAGVILLSILSKKYPFFRADDDITALAEITFLVGTKEMRDAACSIGSLSFFFFYLIFRMNFHLSKLILYFIDQMLVI